MKPFFKIFLLLSFFLQNRIAEAGNCIPPGTTVTLTRQSEVDSFPINYPDCDVVEGLLIISGDDITNLNGLISITQINYLIIKDNLSLSNLTGLNSLKNIVVQLSIENNYNLTTLDGLNSLKSINGISIINNRLLLNLNGLYSLSSVHNNFSIINNLSLISIGALTSLVTVNNSLEISGNPKLSNLTGLNNLKTVDWLGIINDSSLVNLSGLNSLKNIRVLHINGNENLINLHGIDSIVNLESLNVQNNPLIINLEGFNSIKSVSRISISYNASLKNLSGLNNVSSVSVFYVDDNNSLISIDGVLNTNLDTIDNIRITGNPQLLSLAGLENITVITNLEINNNSKLINLNELANLKEIRYMIEIENNSSLVNLNGLNSLNYVGFYLFIRGNSELIDISALNSVTTVVDFMDISYNSKLQNLYGLGNVLNVDRVNIRYNPLLENINDLNPSLFIEQSFQIYENSKLSCCVFVNVLIDNNPSLALTVFTQVYNNDIGCNSIPEIRALGSTPLCCLTTTKINNKIICDGESYSVGLHIYSTTGTYRDTFPIGAGCDSIIITNLTVRAKSYTIQNKNLCIGQSFTLSNGRVITSNGIYKDTIPNICDSIIEYRLSFLSNITTNQNPTICKGKSFTLPKGNIVSVSGIYRDTLRASFGCDSIVITNLTVTNPIPFNNNVTICSGKTFTLPNGNIVSTAGVYYDTIKAPNTCDSIVITNLTVTPYLQSAQTSTVCLGKSFVLPGGRSVSQNGIYKDTIRNNFGCDSIITTNLTITNPIPFTNTVAICDGQSYTLPNGKKVSRAGIYKDTLRQLNTCDSIIVTNLSVFPNNFTVSLHASDTVESGNGITLLPVLSFGTAVSWNWTPAASLSCTACENPVANPTQNTLYTLTVKATDGCEDTAQTNIIVRRTNVYIPSAFTPNNDGVNDVAEVFAINPKSFSFKIYNRWGELVFESYDVSNKWNGTFKGEDCPQDNYSYILDVTMQNDKTYHKQGGILLLR